MITYLAWYTFIVTALSTLIVVFSKRASGDRFAIALLNSPVIVFAYNVLFNK